MRLVKLLEMPPELLLVVPPELPLVVLPDLQFVVQFVELLDL